jgi:large subunit ribosomal protein L29
VSDRSAQLTDMRGAAPDDLAVQADDLREKLFKLRYAAIAESVENSKQIRAIRKQIARIKTVLRERELAGAAKAEK